jgi:hypothetical protein
MVRECVLGLLLAQLAGCSLILDFSESAIPIDAAPDSPFTEEQCAYREPNNSIAEAAAITTAEMGVAAICASDPEDHDFYRFTVPDLTASVAISIQFTSNSSGNRDLDLQLFDAAGTMVAQSRSFADNETITCPAASPACQALVAGDYVFEVFPAQAGATNNYAIALTITPM